MNKKGFTLIELLAVILILGIIALIAIPAITDVIDDAKKGAEETTINHIIKAYNDYYQLRTLKNETVISNFMTNGTVNSEFVDNETHQWAKFKVSNDKLNADEVAKEIGLNGDLDKTFIELKLVNGNAAVKYEVGNWECTNIGESDAILPQGSCKTKSS